MTFFYSMLNSSTSNSKYTAIKQIHWIDIQNDRGISSLVTYITFNKAISYVYSNNEVSIRLTLTALELQEQFLSLSPVEYSFLYKMESLKYNVLLRLSATGELPYIENEAAIKQQWKRLKSDLPKETSATLDELILKVDILFGQETFTYGEPFIMDNLIQMLFPPILNKGPVKFLWKIHPT